MLRLQNLEGHPLLTLPGLAMSTWQLESVFGSKAEGPSFPADHSLPDSCRKDKWELQFQFKGSGGTQLLCGRSRGVTSLTQEDTVEGERK